MAELALGIVSLAGLFNNAVDSYGYIRLGQHLIKTSEGARPSGIVAGTSSSSLLRARSARILRGRAASGSTRLGTALLDRLKVKLVVADWRCDTAD